MKIKYTITGIDCPNCAAKLAGQIGEIEGIDSAKINFLTEKLTVETTLSEEDARRVITKCAVAFSRDIKVD
jgi:copper chaperone CopZ